MSQRKQNVPAVDVSVTRKRTNCGASTILAVDIARKLRDLQAKWKEGLSVRKLTGELIDEHGLAFGKSTVQRWSGALGMKRFRRYLKPKLMRRHHIARLKHSLGEPVKGDDGEYLVSAVCICGFGVCVDCAFLTLACCL